MTFARIQFSAQFIGYKFSFTPIDLVRSFLMAYPKIIYEGGVVSQA